MPVNTIQLNDMQQFDWNKIIGLGPCIDDLNNAQWRFIKGLIAELTTEKHSNNELIYVGAVHRDFDWPRHNIGVELKSQFSTKMYNKNGKLKDKFDIKLSNSNGTNKQSVLNPDNVADIIIVLRRDGAFAIDKNTAIANSIQTGDGFSVRVTAADIDLLTTGPITITNTKSLNLKQDIFDAIKAIIP
jgi:hypothetical protein